MRSLLNPTSGGGTSWTGTTACVTGSVCTYQNDWYYQCVPGVSTATTTPASSTKTSTSSTSSPTLPINANYWFSFGDSYTQTGFDPALTLPAIGNPLGNPTYPGYTATGGENWVDYVTTKFNNSLLFTYNYAYGGATIDATLVAPYTPTVLSLTDQVNQFLSGAGTQPVATPWTSTNSLFSIWIGINDIGNSYYLGGDRDAFSETLLTVEFTLVQKLVCLYSNVGARNFLFVNVPPIDRSPLMTAQGTSATSLEASVITGFNSKLSQYAAAFKANNTGVTIYFWDSNTQFSTILDNPSAYGFIDNSTIGSNSNDFWGNNYHPSSYAHYYFGQEVGQVVLKNTIW
ncbi:Thermolabile hemolysin [Termitomyces sp. J132]|nr:Thermolabile hemolysin [Termitomyces sp. J132]